MYKSQVVHYLFHPQGRPDAITPSLINTMSHGASPFLLYSFVDLTKQMTSGFRNLPSAPPDRVPELVPISKCILP